MELVRTEIRDGVAVLTLNDPKRRNALSLPLARAVQGALETLAEDPAVGALVVTGEPPAFSAGADLSDLEQADRERLQSIYDGFLSVARFPLPTIAAVNGAAVGAGLNLALACDIRIAGKRALFDSRFIDLALHPGGGHTWMLRQLLGPQGAAAMVLCGEALKGEEAVRRGLAWDCVEDDALLRRATALAAHAAATPREMVAKLKATLRGMAGVSDHGEAVARELDPQLWSTEQPEFRARLAALKRHIKGV